MSPVLISNGMEQTIQYNLSKDFVITAEDDGEVAEVDDATGIVIVKYKNGKSQAIDTRPKVVKNSSSGFYMSNKLNCDLKLGQKVKAKDVLAYDSRFFSNDSFNGNRFNLGSLQKVAVMSSYATFEDSTIITKKMSEEMATSVVMPINVTIGTNSNVYNMVNIGDEVHVGDILIEFDTSFEDDEINKFLAGLSDDMQEHYKSLAKVPVKTKYTGVVEDIKVYCTVDLDELSPSLKKVVSGYYSKINKKEKLINKYDDSKGIYKAGILLTESSGKLTPGPDGKIKGREVFDGVLIEFYIKYNDIVGVGDKVAKRIIGDVKHFELREFLLNLNY